jgi:hypothetical protein
LHARLRVHLASGIPCALFYRAYAKFLQNSGAWRREIAEARPVVIPAKAGDPVRRGFSAQSPAPLEYWVARSSRAMTSEKNSLFEI